MARSSAKPSDALVLFDIDGTLIRRAGPHHREVLVDSIRTLCGVHTTTDNIPVQGMLDRDILCLMLENAGIHPEIVRDWIPAIARRAQSMYVRRCPDLKNKVCPGVRPVLGRLRRRGIPMGLVTGNLTRIGWRKMTQAGLRPYFRFGAFADQGRDRTELVRIAIDRARQERWIHDRSLITLIGDHENDIHAAQANGIRIIAVQTGVSDPAALAACRPDLLLPDFRALKLKMLVP